MKQHIVYILLFGLCACKKFVSINPPINTIPRTEVFTSDEKANAAVAAIYGNMINGEQSFSTFLTTIQLGMSGSELSRFNASDTYQEFMTHDLTADNSFVNTIYRTLYKQIYFANSIIEGLKQSTAVTPSVSTQLQGEARFIRAFCYFYLVYLYGDVPLILSTDYATNALLPRTERTTVLLQIENDLLEAKSSVGDIFSNGEKGRPTKWAVMALLSRFYLYQKDWNGAEREASAVLGSGLFTPLPSLNSAFLKNSKEAIWQLAPRSGLLPEVQQSRPSAGTPRNIIGRPLLDSFEAGDQRRTRWLDSVTYQTVRYYYPGKYKNTTSANIVEYYMVLRASEQLLIRA